MLPAGANVSCPHVQLVDAVVAEATCDGKKKCTSFFLLIFLHMSSISPRNPTPPKRSPTSSPNSTGSGSIWQDLTGNPINEEIETGDKIFE